MVMVKSRKVFEDLGSENAEMREERRERKKYAKELKSERDAFSFHFLE